MQTFFTGDIKKRDKVLDYLYSKKIKYIYCEQYSLLKQLECKNDDITEINLERNFVYVFEWNDKKVKKEHLMAL